MPWLEPLPHALKPCQGPLIKSQAGAASPTLNSSCSINLALLPRSEPASSSNERPVQKCSQMVIGLHQPLFYQVEFSSMEWKPNQRGFSEISLSLLTRSLLVTSLGVMTGDLQDPLMCDSSSWLAHHHKTAAPPPASSPNSTEEVKDRNWERAVLTSGKPLSPRHA